MADSSPTAEEIPSIELSFFRRIRRKIETAFGRLGFWIFPRIPYVLLIRLSRVLGFLAFYFASNLRKVALANLDIVFGASKSPQEKQLIAKKAFQSFSRTTLETLAAERLVRDGLQNRFEFAPGSLDLLHELVSRKKGLLALTFHYGNWEWLSLSWGMAGFPVTAVAQRIKNPEIETLYRTNRELAGHRLLNRRHAAKQLYKTLKRGQIVGLLVDLNSSVEEGGNFFEFFGLPALTTRAVGLLALRTGAPIVCSIAYPTSGNRYRIEIGPEITYEPSPVFDSQEIDRITRRWLDHCESVIRERPEQWMWMYKRWKVRATENPGKYPFYSFYDPKTVRALAPTS
jgi:KDO2-lipid IV(A) lauroyltransferase